MKRKDKVGVTLFALTAVLAWAGCAEAPESHGQPRMPDEGPPSVAGDYWQQQQILSYRDDDGDWQVRRGCIPLKIHTDGRIVEDFLDLVDRDEDGSGSWMSVYPDRRRTIESTLEWDSAEGTYWQVYSTGINRLKVQPYGLLKPWEGSNYSDLGTRWYVSRLECVRNLLEEERGS